MSNPLDPDELRTLSRRLDGHAAQLRERAGVLTAGAEGVHWRSTAAEAFRGEARGLAASFRHAAEALTHAAGTLRGHAATVREVQHALLAAERVATGAVGLAVDVGADIGGGVAALFS